MQQPHLTVCRVPAKMFTKPSLGSDVKRAWLRFLLRKPDTEMVALLIDPKASFPSRVGALRGEEVSKRIAASEAATHVFVFRENHLDEVIESLPGLLAEIAPYPRVTLLAPRRTRAPTKRRPGHDVHGALVDIATFRELPSEAYKKPKSIAYHAAMLALESADPDYALLVRQIPCSLPDPPRVPAGRSLRVVIPHRGDLHHIRNCLRRTLAATKGLDARVHVALDEEPRDDHQALAREFPAVRFWRVEPCGGGPYVPRHILGSAAQETYVAFQDSDDVPTRDRFARLLADAEAEGADMIGSHVVDLHEDRHRGKAMRYPVDAVTPIETKPQNTVFHPTTLVRTTALKAAGGFSTIRRMASDREFNLRVFFLSQTLRNTDEFLYVRRMRADSLIHSPETGMRSTARRELHVMWHIDWVRILNQELRLEESSIRATHLDPMPVLVPIEPSSEAPSVRGAQRSELP